MTEIPSASRSSVLNGSAIHKDAGILYASSIPLCDFSLTVRLWERRRESFQQPSESCWCTITRSYSLSFKELEFTLWIRDQFQKDKGNLHECWWVHERQLNGVWTLIHGRIASFPSSFTPIAWCGGNGGSICLWTRTTNKEMCVLWTKRNPDQLAVSWHWPISYQCLVKRRPYRGFLLENGRLVTWRSSIQLLIHRLWFFLIFGEAVSLSDTRLQRLRTSFCVPGDYQGFLPPDQRWVNGLEANSSLSELICLSSQRREMNHLHTSNLTVWRCGTKGLDCQQLMVATTRPLKLERQAPWIIALLIHCWWFLTHGITGGSIYRWNLSYAKSLMHWLLDPGQLLS